MHAQRTDNDLWHQGYLVLDSKDTLKGLVKFDFINNYVEYQQGDDYRILLPGKFNHVFYLSSIDSSSHHLDVYSIQTSKDYYRPYFFEILDTTSKFKYAQQYYWIKRASSFGQIGGFTTISEKVVTLYQIKNNEATYIKPRRNFILKLLSDKKDLVKKKALEKGWRFNNYNNLLKIFTYYNTL